MSAEVTRRGATATLLSLPGAAGAPLRRGQPIEPSTTGYAQAWLIEGASRLLFVSGQTPTDKDGRAPDSFAAQARLAWANVRAQLHAAGMDFANLAKVTIYLSDRAHRAENTRIRAEVLGAATPAITVIIAHIFDEAWLVEIEAIACG
ncbi:RidA family protein [Phenylobacterium sp. J426]|uniref:RidA family protein n=1 Tax=Phenylobacterium sp. J426 TaxID=2898439 RepID=UPI002150D6C8|nr:RidA family protein [Phenylobacterium sp. J426]MCR5876411.1 RidA family protein [Phenylobacterium sp. J426]